MNARWAARIILIVMLVGFILLLAHLQSRLVQMRNSQRSAPTSTR